MVNPLKATHSNSEMPCHKGIITCILAVTSLITEYCDTILPPFQYDEACSISLSWQQDLSYSPPIAFLWFLIKRFVKIYPEIVCQLP